MPNDKGIRSTIMRLAERPEGVTTGEASKAAGIGHESTVQRTLYELTRAGRLIKAGPHMKSRWFVHEQHAQSFARATASLAVGVTIRNGPSDHIRKMHEATMNAARRQGPAARLEGEPVITDKTKVTIAPTPRSRYQVDEAPRVVSSDECRPWAREVR